MWLSVGPTGEIEMTIQAVPHDEAMKVRQDGVYFRRRLEQQDEIMLNFGHVARAVLWEGTGLTSASARCFFEQPPSFFFFAQS